MRVGLIASRIGSPPPCGEGSVVEVTAQDARDSARIRHLRRHSPIKASSRLFTPPLAPPHQGERSRASFVASVVLGLSAAALWTQAAWACTVPEGFVRLASSEAEIAYRWQPERLEVGQFFAAEVIACRAPGADAVREVILDAQMPAHGHGMNYRPTATQLAPDRFRITGLMLHMAGRWRLTFDLIQGDRRTRLAQDVDLKP